MRLEDLLEQSAQTHPENDAVFEPNGRRITHKDLKIYADKIHQELADIGIQRGDRVGLCLNKSIDAVASIFGILKLGCAYVPVDYSAPVSRNTLIFNDCDVRAIICDQSVSDQHISLLEHGSWEKAPYPKRHDTEDKLTILARTDPRPTKSTASDELAYILYTSGSTGRPKGVMHTHESAFAFLNWCTEEFAPTATDRFSSHAPFHFDLSILDIYVPIRHGASIMLLDSTIGKQPGALAEIIADHKISVWYSTPSILRMLMDFGDLPSRDYTRLRLVLFAGEVFPTKHLNALLQHWPSPAYYNLYGPTETNVCTYYRVETMDSSVSATSLPIGKVCSKDDAKVLTEDGTEVPSGAEGELVIAGGSVMSGYWNLPDRNQEAFVGLADRNWYRTGDIVRLDDQGDFIFMGRRDRMIKRRGYRVELGEIEAALHRHPEISEAAVVSNISEESDVQVTAYIAWVGEDPPSTIKLKKFCSEQLPLYFMPDRFQQLNELPKTSTDKIDYQKLKGLA